VGPGGRLRRTGRAGCCTAALLSSPVSLLETGIVVRA